MDPKAEKGNQAKETLFKIESNGTGIEVENQDNPVTVVT